MDKEIYASVGDIKEKITILTVKLDEYLKEIDETKTDVKELDKDTEIKLDKLTKVCSELKENINLLKIEETKHASNLAFLTKAFWLVAATVASLMGYIIKQSLGK